MSSTANRVVKNTGFLYAKMGITMFISLYTTRLILNSLGAADFGIFNIVGGSGHRCVQESQHGYGSTYEIEYTDIGCSQ